MDYDFIAHMMEKKLGNPKEFFPKLFGDKAYPMVTECMVNEIQSSGSANADVLRKMSYYERAPCGHQKGEKSGEECLRDVFATPRYCLAGRSKWSLKLAYYFPHVIVLMWDPQNVLVLRAPSDSSKDSAERDMEGRRIRVGDLERQMTKEAIAEERRERTEMNKELSKKIAYKLRFHHKPVAKGPNPLSMLKRMDPEERARQRALNPFRQFGGEGAAPHDPNVLSRSKLRRKRKRMEMSSHSASSLSTESKMEVAETATTSAITSSPLPTTTPSESTPTPGKTIRKRRKPRAKPTEAGPDQTHAYRTGHMKADAIAEAAASN